MNEYDTYLNRKFKIKSYIYPWITENDNSEN